MVIDDDIEKTQKNIIRRLTRIFRSKTTTNNFTFLECVTKTRVPVLKLSHKILKKHIDITFYNSLAVKNSLLIKSYADFHPKVKALFLIVKEFFCAADLVDTRLFSSYSTTIMAIHFLQKNGALPNLQENADNVSELHEDTVSGKTWNTFFIRNSSVPVL